MPTTLRVALTSRRTALLAALPVLAVAACGETTIDKAKAEDLARKIGNSGSVKLEKAACPEDVAAKKGETFKCELAYADGTPGTITVHITSDSGDIRTSGRDIEVREQ